jgi:hypothetical protein
MPAPLINANTQPLNENSANLPDVSAAVAAFLYPMTFEFNQVTMVDGYAQSVPIKISTQASIQPFTERELKVLPEGERAWSWYLLHSLTNLNLKVNDKVKIGSERYKVMASANWSRNQYWLYHVVLDYQYPSGQAQSV